MRTIANSIRAGLLHQQLIEKRANIRAGADHWRLYQLSH
jgi:hypothetical protein